MKSAGESVKATAPGLGKHMPALDGLRGVAILLVMVFHFGWAAKAMGKPAKALVFLTNFGWTGVDLFFVLSGFLITGILLDSKDRPGYFRNFYARRVLRIFPLYYGVLVVTLLILPLFVSYDSPDLQLVLQSQGWLWAYSENVSVALRHGEWIWNPGWLRLGMLWSLAVEEHFYLVWPLLMYLLSRRAAFRLSLGVVLAGPILRALALHAGVAPYTVYCLTIFRADSLAMGGLIAIVVRDPRLARMAVKNAKWAMLAGAGVILLVTARLRFLVHNDPIVETYGFSALALVYGAILLTAVSGSPTSPLSRVLSHPGLRFFGKYSYGAYLIHELLRPAFVWLFPIEKIERVTGEVPAFLVHAALGIAITFSLAVVCFKVYEKPFLDLKRFFEYREAPIQPAALPEADG